MKWIILGIALVLNSCTTSTPSSGVETIVYDIDEGTRAYNEVLKKYWRSETVFSNYETIYFLNVAGFLPEFQEAFKKASDERFNGLNLLKKFGSQPIFVVSIYAVHDDMTDLTNDKIWEFVLKVGIREFPVKSVAKLRDKDTWSSFFPFINRWSLDYMVIFDVPQDSLMREKVTLFLSNAKAKTAINWSSR